MGNVVALDDAINSAKSSLRGVIYEFTDPVIEKALVDARDRVITVQMSPTTKLPRAGTVSCPTWWFVELTSDWTRSTQ